METYLLIGLFVTSLILIADSEGAKLNPAQMLLFIAFSTALHPIVIFAATDSKSRASDDKELFLLMIGLISWIGCAGLIAINMYTGTLFSAVIIYGLVFAYLLVSIKGFQLAVKVKNKNKSTKFNKDDL